MSEARYQEQSQEEEEVKPKVTNPNLEKLRKNCCVRLSGRIFGLLVPITTLVFMSFFTFFGKWDLRAQKDCYAVEFPNDVQFDREPT